MTSRHAHTDEIARTSVGYTPRRAAVETVEIAPVVKPLSALAREYDDADSGAWRTSGK